MNNKIFYIAFILALISCSKKSAYDASGTFETDELIVSAEQNGAILSLPFKEGDTLQAGQKVGAIDVTNLELQKQQREASVQAITEKTVDAGPQLTLVSKQLSVQEAQLKQQLHERVRLTNLVNADAAPRKQLDDINAAIDQLQKQMAVTRQQIQLYQSNISTQNRSVLSEKQPAEKSVAIVEDQIKKGTIINPIYGVVLTKYALQGEYTTVGRPLYKIADIHQMTLRTYITGSQLSQVKLNQKINVFIDQGKDNLKQYPGTITWISDKAEFTPKTIQTKEERANLVYAIKVVVPNDGFLKIGMYGEVKF